MKITTFIVACCFWLAVFLFAQRRAPQPAPQPMFSAVIDLTHKINAKASILEGGERSPFETRGGSATGQSANLTIPEHFSTYVDAPSHFATGRWTVDQIPAERLIAPLVVIDVSGKARVNQDYELTVDDIGTWEVSNGRIPPGAVVMANTGWSAKWKSAQEYRGADAKGVLHFPGFSLDAARFLVEARTAFGLGIDTLSIDAGVSAGLAVHKYTANRNIYHLENVADLSHAPEAGAIVVVAPAKLEGGDGSPVRILVLLPRPQA